MAAPGTIDQGAVLLGDASSDEARAALAARICRRLAVHAATRELVLRVDLRARGVAT
jgi:hypothetical protein